MADNVMITEYDRDKYARKLWAMSNAELASQINQNAVDSMTLDFRLPSSKLKADELLKEAKICGEILAERPKRTKALEKWKKDLPTRREKAILNLPVASSANGQLIAAIIEEEGALTAGEIGAWCEELEAFDPEEIVEMLNAMVKEGILYEEDGRYSLRCLCTETLFPKDPVAWGVEEVKRAGIIHRSAVIKDKYYDTPYRLLLTLIANHNYSTCPVYPEELYLDMENKKGIDGNYISKEFRVFTEEDYNESNSRIRYILGQMADAGILTEEDGHYYFTMLGERKGDANA